MYSGSSWNEPSTNQTESKTIGQDQNLHRIRKDAGIVRESMTLQIHLGLGFLASIAKIIHIINFFCFKFKVIYHRNPQEMNTIQHHALGGYLSACVCEVYPVINRPDQLGQSKPSFHLAVSLGAFVQK